MIWWNQKSLKSSILWWRTFIETFQNMWSKLHLESDNTSILKKKLLRCKEVLKVHQNDQPLETRLARETNEPFIKYLYKKLTPLILMKEQCSNYVSDEDAFEVWKGMHWEMEEEKLLLYELKIRMFSSSWLKSLKMKCFLK